MVQRTNLDIIKEIQALSRLEKGLRGLMELQKTGPLKKLVIKFLIRITVRRARKVFKIIKETK